MANSVSEKRIGLDFTSGPVFPLLLKYLVPFFLANILNSLYNTVDTMIVGQLVGSTGIVAVSLGGKMLNLFTNMGIALAGGGQILIAQITGAKKRNELNSAIGTMFTEMFALSVIFAVVTLILSPNIITWLNTPIKAYSAALQYLRITCIGLPLIFGYNAISSVLRGMGDSWRPLLFTAYACIFNIIGDYVFIIVFDLGVAGTAIATVLGQGLSVIVSLALLYRKKEYFGFDFKLKSLAIDWNKCAIMVKLGLPNAVRAFFITGTQLVLMGYINTFGVAEAAAYSIGDKIYHISNVFSTSVLVAGGSVVGQNFAVRDYKRIKRIMLDCFILTMSAAVVLCAVSLAFPDVIFGLFTKDPEVLKFARPIIYICCLVYVLASIHGSYESVVAGTGNAFLRMFGGILDGCVFRIGFSALFAYVLEMGVAGFLLADAVSRLAPILIGMIYYHSGIWKKRKTLVEK